MTPEERKILEEADDQAFQSSQELADAQISKGVRPEPTIDSTETTLEGQSFGLDFGGDSTGQANVEATPGGGTFPPPSGPTGACCIGPYCFILDAAGCAAAGGIYQGDSVPCSPDPC